MNNSFGEAICFLLGIWAGIWAGFMICGIVIKVSYITPCERDLPRNMHCELTAKISGDKHE